MEYTEIEDFNELGHLWDGLRTPQELQEDIKNGKLRMYEVLIESDPVENGVQFTDYIRTRSFENAAEIVKIMKKDGDVFAEIEDYEYRNGKFYYKYWQLEDILEWEKKKKSANSENEKFARFKKKTVKVRKRYGVGKDWENNPKTYVEFEAYVYNNKYGLPYDIFDIKGSNLPKEAYYLRFANFEDAYYAMKQLHKTSMNKHIRCSYRTRKDSGYYSFEEMEGISATEKLNYI